MKKAICLVTVFGLALFACTKSGAEEKEEDFGLPSSPETKPQYDNANFGVYKGVIVGSSGWIVFRINNGNNEVKGYLEIDNQKDTLSTDATINLGEPISNVLFEGRISSMKVSANANGTNAKLSDIQINGHNNVTGFIIHENSTNQVFCYEGTFNGTSTGIINATRLKNGDTTYLLSKLYQKTINEVLRNADNDTLYLGYAWNNNDSAIGYLGAWTWDNVNPHFNIAGKFSDSSNTTSTFHGTWSSRPYGNGEFTTRRTY